MTHRVAMLAFPDAQVLDVIGPLEVFSRTARWLADTWGRAEPAYSVEVVAAQAGPVRMSSGLELTASRSFRDLDACDTLLVAGGIGWAGAAQDAGLLAWLRGMAGQVERLGSICTGALILGAAGLLEGRAATTHWAYCDRLAALAPGCDIAPDAIFVESGGVFTSAGVTTGMDLALEMVERDWGKATAVAVAQELVIYRKRPGGQGQFSRFLEAERREDVFGRLQLWVLDHLDEDLPLERLAAVAGMSPRHFSRRFRAEMGATPAAWVGKVRLEEARRRLESGAGSLKDVARGCGFQDEQNLRRAFRRRLGVAPSDYRERFGG
ncbi:GlxA family transcriptional regulator [Phenylobacterium sp.]|uniref:GlxA family transcriptional regulator n=1 Tax=Phenylobacterium sp. TaxID=1871053 RepID=UPI002B8DCBFD|nr:GlxA family transcriptional regulator [Phenylobacterium sp.]HVI34260.1 GlxA family transcriptional regulator [Phenylobacterium sp.]